MCRINFILFALSWAAAVQVERSADDICMRADGRAGYCIDLRNCSTLFNSIKRNYTRIKLTHDEYTYMMNSKCPVHKEGYVCCEAEEQVSQGIQNLTAQNCGDFDVPKVMGGTQIRLMSRPWMALLKFRTSLDVEDFTCGGTIINERYILTAAHCFNNQQLLSVRLGEHNITSETDCERIRGRHVCAPPVEDFEIDRVYIHEQYTPGIGHNDIALVKLKGSVAFKQSIKPICLPVNETLQQNVEAMKLFQVTGWGKTEHSLLSDVPLETKIVNKARGTCEAAFNREILASQICAGQVHHDSCNGDSGGPLIFVDIFNETQRFINFGIVSYGSGICGDGNPGVYTNVASYIPWIAYKIATK